MPETLVFEIGTEEMPAGAVASGVAQLGANAEELLRDFRLKPPGSDTVVDVWATPRRLVLVVRGLATEQASDIEEIKGPPKRIAFTDTGEPAPAALGFAKTQGVDVKDLEVREAEGGEYVFAVKKRPGQPTLTVLPDLLIELVKSLEFKRTMRWGSGRLRFIRPIRWLLALYGEDVLPLELDELKAGRLTWGHRFLAEGPFEVASADDYESIMKQARVVRVSQADLRGSIEDAAKAAGGRAAVNPRVLAEVAYLVEDPHTVVGSFDKEFLKIPRAVAVTAMESHQRYFPLEDAEGKLLPLFAVVHNGDPAWDDQIRHGHERVLRARLADAAFFFHEDTKTTLESKVDRLKEVAWQKKLGTVYDKVERARALSALIAGKLALEQEAQAKIERAALLAKADLTTAMVIEFTELQGIIGSEYALIDGEDAEVAAAIAEHYQPRSAGDGAAETTTGRVVGLADKLDTIAGCFIVGLVPTGSADPYSLRRQATGIVGILAATGWQIGIMELTKSAIDNYARAGVKSADPETVIVQVQEFIIARLRRSLSEEGMETDAVEAVLGAGFDEVGAVTARVRIIEKFRGKNELEDIKLAFTRCHNLAKAETRTDVDEALFETAEERALFAACKETAARMAETTTADSDLEGAIGLLAKMRAPIDEFFEAVLVMAPDERIRANRLRLLNLCVDLSHQVADFSKLV